MHYEIETLIRLWYVKLVGELAIGLCFIQMLVNYRDELILTPQASCPAINFLMLHIESVMHQLAHKEVHHSIAG